MADEWICNWCAWPLEWADYGQQMPDGRWALLHRACARKIESIHIAGLAGDTIAPISTLPGDRAGTPGASGNGTPEGSVEGR